MENTKQGDFIKHLKGQWEGTILKVVPYKFETSGGYFVVRFSDGQEIELHRNEFKIEHKL